MAVISYNSRVGLAKETTWGTAVAAPTMWVPFNTLKSEDDIKRIVDKGKRGNLTQDFASYAGVASGKFDIDGEVYPDLLGNFLLGLFGQDSVTGTGPYTHKFQLANTQPPSYTMFDYDGSGASVPERYYAGAVVEGLDFKFTSEGELTKSVKMVSKASAISASVHTPTYGSAPIFLGWQAALTIGGSANTRLIGGDINFKRPTKFTFGANNSQAPTKVNVGVMEVTGKLDFEIDDYTELNYYLQTTQPAVVLTFTGTAPYVLTIQMSKCDFEKVAGLDRSQEMVRMSANIRGLYNTTDGGPALVQLVNSTATY